MAEIGADQAAAVIAVDDPIENDLGEVIGGVKSEGLADISLSATYSMDFGVGQLSRSHRATDAADRR